jgi:uncharacterized protein (TIGR03067 family)
MRAGILPVLAACLLVAGAGRADAAGTKADDDATKKELASLDGTWVIAGREFEGKQATDDQIRALRTKIIIKDGQVAIWTDDNADGKEELTREATLKLDPTAKPRALDLTFTSGDLKGKTNQAIYEIDGDTLKVCFAVLDAERPTDFAGKADGKALFMTYKRVKK